MVSRIREDKDKLVIDILPRKLTPVELKRMVFLFVMGIVSFFVIAGLSNLRNLSFDRIIFYLPIGILIILFAIMPVLRQTKKSWKITKSPTSVLMKKMISGRNSLSIRMMPLVFLFRLQSLTHTTGLMNLKNFPMGESGP